MNAKALCLLGVSFMCTSQFLQAEIWNVSRAYVDYNFGQYINITDSYTDLELFMPMFGNEKNILALDAQGIIFNDSRGAFNGGLVFRKCLFDKHVVGLNAFYDYLRAPCHADFNRIGLGAEWLTNNYDVRVNGYFPTWKSHYDFDTCVFDNIGGGYFATETKAISAYKGFDAEVGRMLWKKSDFGFYGAVGPYYYHQTCLYAFWGASVRLELNWRSYVYLKARASFDHAYHANVQGVVGISIPLDFNFKKDPADKRCQSNLKKRIVREGIILTETYCDWTWNWND